MVKNRIKEIIAESGLKQNFVAQKVGVTDSLMSQWANNKKQPKIQNLMKLSNVLGCKIEELYGRLR